MRSILRNVFCLEAVPATIAVGYGLVLWHPAPAFAATPSYVSMLQLGISENVLGSIAVIVGAAQLIALATRRRRVQVVSIAGLTFLYIFVAGMIWWSSYQTSTVSTGAPTYSLLAVWSFLCLMFGNHRRE